MQSLFSRWLNQAKYKAELFERKRWIFAVAAILLFPLFFFIWHDLFPQPYENLWLRLLGSALFIPIVVDHYRPARNREAMAAYFYLVLIYALPFFFSYMFFRNGNDIWFESGLAALFIMVALFNSAPLLVFSVFGISVAWLAYWLTAAAPYTADVGLERLPIVAFTIVMGMIANHVAEAAALERERAAIRSTEERAQADKEQRIAIFRTVEEVIAEIGTILLQMKFIISQIPRGGSSTQMQRLQINALEQLEGKMNKAIWLLDAILENSNPYPPSEGKEVEKETDQA